MKYFFSIFFLFPLFAFAQQPKSAQQSYILMRLNEQVDGSNFIKQFQANSRNKPALKIKRQVSKILNIYSLQYNPLTTDGDWLIEALRKNKQVLDAGYDTPLTYRNTIPNDDFFGEQWNLERIQLPQVWDETTGGMTANGDEIVIAVLEKGIELEHPDIFENIWTNEQEIPDNGIDDDGNGYVDDYYGLNLDDLTDNHPVLRHGTQVSGIIGASTNNAIGMAGINWKVKVLFMSGVDLVSEVIEAYEYLFFLRKRYNETRGQRGAFIVANNNSFGWDNTRPEELRMGAELCQMFDVMGSAGILSAGAGPNNDVNVESVGDTPTNCKSDYFIGVTSTNRDDEKSFDGGFGELSIDIGAPGEAIQATDKGGEYGGFSGTSFATPHVTGVIGLMYALPCKQLASDALNNAPQTALFLKNIMLAGTDAITGLKGRTVSGGRLNAFKMMINLQAYCGTRGGEKLDIFNLYPNPTDAGITLEYETKDFETHQLIISNALGQVVFEKSFIPPRFAEPVIKETLTGLSPGVYRLTLKRRGQMVTKSFVVKAF